MRISWDRCDRIGCKGNPIALIEFRGEPSILTGSVYDIQVRVCKKDFDAEAKDPSMRVIKKRSQQSVDSGM